MINPDIRNGRYVLYAPDGSVFTPPLGSDYKSYLAKGFRLTPPPGSPAPTPKPDGKRKREHID